MENLFTKLEKTAEMGSFLLDGDSTQWVRQILQNFLNEYPFLQNEPMSIAWQKWMPEKGYAVGTLSLLDGAAPIIVNDYRVSPIDVMMWGDITAPINKELLLKLTSNPNAFSGLMNTEKKLTDSLFKENSQFSPTSENARSRSYTVSRPAVKVASFLETLDSAELSDVKELLKASKPYVEKFEANGTEESLQKLATLNFTNSNTSWYRDLVADRQYVYKAPTGEILVKQANSKVDLEWNIVLSEEEAKGVKNIFNTETAPTVKIASVKGKKIKGTPELDTVGIFESNDIKTPAFKITKQASVKGDDKIVVFPLESGSLLIDKDTKNWSVKTAEFFKKDEEWVKTAQSVPKVGQTGFLYSGGEAFGPYEILSQSILGNSFTKTASIDLRVVKPGTLKPENLKITSLQFEKVGFVENGEKHFPKNTIWVPLNKEADLKLPLDEMEIYQGLSLNNSKPITVILADNVSNVELTKNAHVLPKTAQFYTYTTETGYETKSDQSAYVMRDLSGEYHFSKEFNKTASETTNLNKDQAKWLLIKMGGTQKDFNELNNLAKGQSYTIEGKLSNPAAPETLVSQILKQASLDKISQLKSLQPESIIKIASSLTDKSSVDAILALGLLRKSNIMQYLAIIPQYEQILGELGKLLIASRLGLAGTNPEIIKQAQDSLSEVVLALKAVEASLSDLR